MVTLNYAPLLEITMFENLFQPMHLLVVLFIALLVFGPKKLPELGKGLGDSIRSFKDSMREKEQSEIKVEEKNEPVATDSSARG
jgi:sec-independent protein translocase protein TatA